MVQELLWRWAATVVVASVLGAAGATSATSCDCITDVPPEGACPVPEDLLLLVPTSVGLAARDTRQVQALLRGLLQQLPLPALQTGLLGYGGAAAVEVSPVQGNLTDLLARVDALPSAAGEGDGFLAPALAQASAALALRTTALVRQVLVILDELPSDLDAVQAQAAQLKAVGTRLTWLWVFGSSGSGGSGSIPAALYSLASTPSTANVLTVASYEYLASAAAQVTTAVRAPCPCVAGRASQLPGPASLTAAMSMDFLRAHGESEEQPCERYFPDYSGTVVLTCADGRLRATSACAPACLAGASVTIAVDGRQAAARLPQRLASDAALSADCGGALAGSVGEVLFLCHQGVLAAAHNCTLQCELGPAVPVDFHGVSLLAAPRTTRGDVLTAGDWTQTPCSDPFGGQVGLLSLACLGGGLRALSDCHGPAQCVAVQDPSSAWQLFSGVVCALGLAVLLTGLARLASSCRRRLRGAKLLAPARRFVTLGLQSELEAPAPILKEAVAQTLPQAYAELVRGGQRPVDIVFCIDSSLSVGAEDFRKAVVFLEQVVQDLQMPPARVGIIRFNHESCTVAPLSAPQDELLELLRAMAFDPGETRLAEPLYEAGRMLDEAMEEGRKRVVAIVSDGDPSDLEDAWRQADALKSRGVLCLFIQVGDLVHPDVARRIASAPPEEFVLYLGNYDELAVASESVLHKVVDVSLLVRRAKCVVNALAYQVVDSLDAIAGHQAMVPGWDAGDHTKWTWDASSRRRIVDPESMPWNPSLPRLVDLEAARAGPGAVNASTQAVAASRELAVQTEESGEPRVPTGNALAQTDPVVKVTLAPYRQAQLDLVVCLDTSNWHGAALRQDAGGRPPNVLAAPRLLLDLICAQAQTPEVHLALVCFKDVQEVLCEFTDDIENFRERLGVAAPSVGEVKFAPALWQAVALLGSRGPHSRWAPDPTGAGAERVVLVVTANAPPDMQDAADAARALRDQRARLMFVNFAQRGRERDPVQLQTLSSLSAHRALVDSAAYPCGVLTAQPTEEAIRDLLPPLLQQLFKATQRVARARCTLPLEPYEDVGANIDDVQGHEVSMCPNLGASMSSTLDRSLTMEAQLSMSAPVAGFLADPAPAAWQPLSEEEAADLAAQKQAERLQERLQESRAQADELRAQLEARREADAAQILALEEAARAAAGRVEAADRERSVLRREADLRLSIAAQRQQDAQARAAAAREEIRSADPQLSPSLRQAVPEPAPQTTPPPPQQPDPPPPASAAIVTAQPPALALEQLGPPPPADAPPAPAPLLEQPPPLASAVVASGAPAGVGAGAPDPPSAGGVPPDAGVAAGPRDGSGGGGAALPSTGVVDGLEAGGGAAAGGGDDEALHLEGEARPTAGAVGAPCAAADVPAAPGTGSAGEPEPGPDPPPPVEAAGAAPGPLEAAAAPPAPPAWEEAPALPGVVEEDVAAPV